MTNYLYKLNQVIKTKPLVWFSTGCLLPTSLVLIPVSFTFMAVEFKHGKNKPTVLQKAFLNTIRAVAPPRSWSTTRAPDIIFEVILKAFLHSGRCGLEGFEERLEDDQCLIVDHEREVTSGADGVEERLLKHGRLVLAVLELDRHEGIGVNRVQVGDADEPNWLAGGIQ